LNSITKFRFLKVFLLLNIFTLSNELRSALIIRSKLNPLNKEDIMSEENQVSRVEHLAWCKKRAIAYCASGDVRGAFTSMASDMSKHPETSGHQAVSLGMMLMISGALQTPAEMQEFIEGFN
jgi:hypothetical protein